jgi:hypothetical protein
MAFKKKAASTPAAAPVEAQAAEIEKPDYSGMTLAELLDEKPGFREWVEKSDFTHMLEEEEESI